MRIWNTGSVTDLNPAEGSGVLWPCVTSQPTDPAPPGLLQIFHPKYFSSRYTLLATILLQSLHSPVPSFLWPLSLFFSSHYKLAGAIS